MLYYHSITQRLHFRYLYLLLNITSNSWKCKTNQFTLHNSKRKRLEKYKTLALQYREISNISLNLCQISTISSLKNARLERDMLQSIEAEAAEILAQLGCPLPRRVVHQDNNRNVAVQLGRLKSSVDRAFDDRLDFYIEVNIVHDMVDYWSLIKRIKN